MKKRQFTSQASSGRAGSGFGAFGGSTFAATSSTLSYVQEPADYSTLSDANVAVAFKNLTKKDSTTKVKALEDLQNVLITSEGEIEDAVVDLWVRSTLPWSTEACSNTAIRSNSILDSPSTQNEESVN